MNDCLQLKKSNCKNCYKCIRNCPVKSIRFSDNQAHIVNDDCILCGMCFVACPQNAKQIRSDVKQVKSMLASPKPVYASIAPSFVANYDGISIDSMEKALKRLGFAGAEETALGATAVKKQYESLIRERRNDVIISSCCHSINTLIEKHRPEMLPHLAKVVSPMQAHGMQLKKKYPDSFVVFIGPCISKKDEVKKYGGYVDCALTFEELSPWLEEEGIFMEECGDHEKQGRARLFPTAGGIINSMDLDPDYNYIAIDGMENCLSAMEDIKNQKLSHCFIEMSACKGSCIGGPVMSKEHHRPVSDYIVVHKTAGTEDFDVPKIEDSKLVRNFSYDGKTRIMPGSTAIEEILRKMGKQKKEQELNCGSCGYNTCRDKAVAVFFGYADLTMCLPFLKEKAESFSDTIINNTPNGIFVLNENLQVQQMNSAACKIFNVQQVQDVLENPIVRVIDPTDYMMVMQSGQNTYGKRKYLAEYHKYIEETIIYDKQYHIIMSIMKDITQEESIKNLKEKQSNQAIEITDRVVEKQMRVVQEIASLLGETTAETKIALTKLKETLTNE